MLGQLVSIWKPPLGNIFREKNNKEPPNKTNKKALQPKLKFISFFPLVLYLKSISLTSILKKTKVK